MKNIAILGGTFNPIHNAHLEMAHQVLATGLYDEILFIPTGDPPHKDEAIVIDKCHRWNMCQLAIQDFDHFHLSNIEIDRIGKTYTVDTLLQLKESNPQNNYHLIIGADSLMDLPKWYNTELLYKICSFVVINRPGFENEFGEQLEYLRSNFNVKLKVIDMPLMAISSSSIREFCEQGKLIDKWVPYKVYNYIEQHHLYDLRLSKPLLDLTFLENKLQSKLSDKRYLHSIAVKDTAIDLAIRFGCNVMQAAIAGVLHDCAKAIDHKKKIKLCEKYGIVITNAEMSTPDLLHAKLGVIIAREKYGIEDFEILDAIECHTTGKPNMSLLDKIIFIADYIEPTRNKAPRLEEIRELAKSSLDETLMVILEDTLEFLKLTNKTIDPKTEETYLFYKETYVKES